MQVLLLQPDILEVLVSLSLHLLPQSLVSMVLSHLLISILPVLFILQLLHCLGRVLGVIYLYLQSRSVLSMALLLMSILQHLHIRCVARSTVSVISRLGLNELLILLDLILRHLLS